MRGTAAVADGYAVMRRYIPVLLVCLLLSACAGSVKLAPPAPQPRFDAVAFFSGNTRGVGKLKIIMSRTTPTLVHGTGHVENGTLVLDQTLDEGARPAKHRVWRIASDAPDHYSGTLTDAVGPVTGDVEGNRLHLAFAMKGGLHIEQWLTLAADARSAHNIMVVKKFGLRVAMLDEQIRKTD